MTRIEVCSSNIVSPNLRCICLKFLQKKKVSEESSSELECQHVMVQWLKHARADPFFWLFPLRLIFWRIGRCTDMQVTSHSSWMGSFQVIGLRGTMEASNADESFKGRLVKVLWWARAQRWGWCALLTRADLKESEERSSSEQERCEMEQHVIANPIFRPKAGFQNGTGEGPSSLLSPRSEVSLQAWCLL